MISTIITRPAATLATTVLHTSGSIPVQGASAVYINAVATNANAPAAYAHEWSWDGGANWIATAAAFITTAGDAMAAAMNGAGGLTALYSPTAGYAIPFTHMRYKITGHATLDITGLAVKTYVSDDAAAQRIAPPWLTAYTTLAPSRPASITGTN